MNRCIWCDSETTKDKNLVSAKIKLADKEHIFPEAVGGRATLDLGLVCKDCNGDLGQRVDAHLKTGNFMMMNQYQISTEILNTPVGKIRNRQDRERKEKEAIDISNGGTSIIRDENNRNYIALIDLPDGSGGDFSYNDKFSKALHKCLVNVLLQEKGYEYVKKNYSELIDFVKNKNNYNFNQWSYAVCYADIFSKVHFEPFCLSIIEVENVILAVELMFPSAIYILCTKPSLMNATLIEQYGNNTPILSNFEKSNFNYIEHFNSQWVSNNSRKLFGEKLKFAFIKKEIKGTKNPEDSFYLLVKCKVCNQTNPTGIMMDKEHIFKGNQNSTTSGTKNTWNIYTKEDLSKQGWNVDKWNEEELQKHIDTQGISYPKENDVKELNISNCQCQCINCGFEIIYDAKDCFI